MLANVSGFISSLKRSDSCKILPSSPSSAGRSEAPLLFRAPIRTSHSSQAASSPPERR
eukprot:CAMPEP_0206232088 /NCGR_PEP_ID=MMETSP0047_2-20121206/11219_1 /ASSEMBLY_ACC=CAM_ASM_000192 /TAXON_ID=195065 /ORGANISM="Chroomonas mesostigmatica_cf, Strain CCMP1168" /LENGTH=57 /DNA_ID=CAMNT_0053655781 /DNA_START=536 /DNA_END=706 /DNA_ORIENTATION=+